MGGSTWQRILGGVQLLSAAGSMYEGNYGGGTALLASGIGNVSGDKHASGANGWKGFMGDLGGYVGGSFLGGGGGTGTGGFGAAFGGGADTSGGLLGGLLGGGGSGGGSGLSGLFGGSGGAGGATPSLTAGGSMIPGGGASAVPSSYPGSMSGFPGVAGAAGAGGGSQSGMMGLLKSPLGAQLVGQMLGGGQQQQPMQAQLPPRPQAQGLPFPQLGGLQMQLPQAI